MRPYLPIGLLLLGSSCTITSVGSEDAPPRVEAEGLVEGHAALGWRDESRLLRLDLLDGSSDGALAEFTLWRLLRLEVGALGLGVGLGPIDLALGTLFYEPEVPQMTSERGSRPESGTAAPATSDDCEICRRAREEAAGQ